MSNAQLWSKRLDVEGLCLANGQPEQGGRGQVRRGFVGVVRLGCERFNVGGQLLANGKRGRGC